MEENESAPVDVPVANESPSTPPPSHATSHDSAKHVQKMERTPKQIAAFERMRAKRKESRALLGAGYDPKPNEKDEYKKSIEHATALFMDMRKKEKENKKEMAWEKLLNDTVTKRMDEFENRLVDLFSEPVEHYVEKRKRKQDKKASIQEQPKEVELLPPVEVHKKETKEPEVKEPDAKKPRYTSKSPFVYASRKPGWSGGRGN
jgi:hypothetical protein